MKDILLVGAIFVAGWFYFENQKLKKAALAPEAPNIPGIPNPKNVSPAPILSGPTQLSFSGEDENPFQ